MLDSLNHFLYKVNMLSFKNSQVGGDMSLENAGHVDLAGAFIKGTADLRGTILSPQRVEGARFGKLFYDATTQFVHEDGKTPYQGKVETAEDKRGWYFVFSR